MLTGRARYGIAAAAVLAVGLFVGGCGFQPLYGAREDGASAASELAAVDVAEKNRRQDQLVRNALISAMSSADSGAGNAYILDFDTTIETLDTDVRATAAVTKRTLTLTANYRLADSGTGEVIHSGRTFSRVSYDRIRQEFANIQAHDDAIERAATEVAENIRTQLAGYFTSR